MKLKRYRNWWGETLREEYERRINALEAHIQELSVTVSQLYAAINRSEYESLVNSGEMRRYDTSEKQAADNSE